MSLICVKKTIIFTTEQFYSSCS